MAISIEYRLPVTAVEVKGTHTYTEDALDLQDGEQREATCDLITVADERIYTLEADGNIFDDAATSFELTEDGRLIGASAEITGALTQVVTGVAGVLTTVAGLAASLKMMGAVKGDLRGALRETPPPSPPPKPSAETVYMDERPEEALLRRALRLRLTGLTKDLPAVCAEATSTDSVKRRNALARLNAATTTIATLRPEVDRADALFKVWRQSKLKTRSVSFTYRLTMNDLLEAGATVSDAGDLTYPEPALYKQAHATAKAKAEAVRIATGIVVVIEDPEGVLGRDWDDAKPSAEAITDRQLIVRAPRPVRVKVYKETVGGDTEPGPLTLLSSEQRLVLDKRSRHQGYDLEEGKKALKFSANGVVTSYTSSQKSTVGAIAEAFSKVPGTVATSLADVNKIYDQYGALQSKSTDRYLAELKRQIEVKTQEIASDGLDANSDNLRELSRLKSDADLMEARKKAGSYGPSVPDAHADEIARLKRDVEELKLKLELAVTRQKLSEQAGP